MMFDIKDIDFSRMPYEQGLALVRASQLIITKEERIIQVLEGTVEVTCMDTRGLALFRKPPRTFVISDTSHALHLPEGISHVLAPRGRATAYVYANKPFEIYR